MSFPNSLAFCMFPRNSFCLHGGASPEQGATQILFAILIHFSVWLQEQAAWSVGRMATWPAQRSKQNPLPS